MKKTISLIVLIFNLNIFSQNLVGTKWLKINTERIDGSVIHDRQKTEAPFIEYHFQTLDKIRINPIKFDVDYTIKESELTIGNQKFTIEKLNDTELIISEKGDANITNDKKDRLFFIESKKLISYLIDKELLVFLNDSTIKVKKYLTPKLKNNKDLTKIILKALKNKKISKSKDKRGYLIGQFHIDTSGKIDSVLIKENLKILKKTENIFIKELKKTNFIPIEIDKKYNQIVDFVISFHQLNTVTGISIHFNSNKKKSNNSKNLSIKDITKTRKYYIQGVTEINKKNYIKAIKKFNEVIAIDSLFFDAYYNRAYTNLIIKNKEKSCVDWKYLKKMGQKEGENLYNQKCK